MLRGDFEMWTLDRPPDLAKLGDGFQLLGEYTPWPAPLALALNSTIIELHLNCFAFSTSHRLIYKLKLTIQAVEKVKFED